jgi:hypothetical protein
MQAISVIANHKLLATLSEGGQALGAVPQFLLHLLENALERCANAVTFQVVRSFTETSTEEIPLMLLLLRVSFQDEPINHHPVLFLMVHRNITVLPRCILLVSRINHEKFKSAHDSF